MKTLFGLSRYLVLIAVISLLAAALAVFILGGLATFTIIVEAFRHSAFSAESSRVIGLELIEMIDFFLLGTILLITSLGLYQLFIDSDLDLPEWLVVTDLEQLKLNLLAVIIVMLGVLFLGQAGGELSENVDILPYGLAVAGVVVAFGLAVFLFQRVHLVKQEHIHEEHILKEERDRVDSIQAKEIE